MAPASRRYGFQGFWGLAYRDSSFRIILIVATTLWLYTSILKQPFVQPNFYSDVGWLWIRDVYQGHHNLQIPYAQYELEYPQVIGLLIYLGQAISTCFPVVIDNYDTFVVAESVLQYPFLIGTLFNLYVLCGRLRLSRNRLYLYVLTTLTFVI